MPWRTDGTFVRENPDFDGDDVWQQDQEAGIKIVDFRHDYHDNDLAQGIANTLNLDGYNKMRADLDMGGFNLINVGSGGEDEMADGSFVPTLPSGFIAGGQHGGTWWRQGRVVNIMAYIEWTFNPQTGGLVPLIIGGLPYAIAAPNGGSINQYLGQLMGYSNILLSGVNPDGSPEKYIRGIRASTTGGPNAVEPVYYIGKDNFGYQTMNDGSVISKASSTVPDNPAQEYFSNAVFTSYIEDLEPTGAFAFTFQYLTNDPQ